MSLSGRCRRGQHKAADQERTHTQKANWIVHPTNMVTNSFSCTDCGSPIYQLRTRAAHGVSSRRRPESQRNRTERASTGRVQNTVRFARPGLSIRRKWCRKFSFRTFLANCVQSAAKRRHSNSYLFGSSATARRLKNKIEATVSHGIASAVGGLCHKAYR